MPTGYNRGDFIAWMAQLGRGDWNGKEEKYKRKSKHKEIDKEGRKMLKLLSETGWLICNGCTRGIGKGSLSL